MIHDDDYYNCGQVIVFFATARLTQFMSMLFTQVFHLPTMEIHSRRAQVIITSSAFRYLGSQLSESLFSLLSTDRTSAQPPRTSLGNLAMSSFSAPMSQPEASILLSLLRNEGLYTYPQRALSQAWITRMSRSYFRWGAHQTGNSTYTALVGLHEQASKAKGCFF